MQIPISLIFVRILSCDTILCKETFFIIILKTITFQFLLLETF